MIAAGLWMASAGGTFTAPAGAGTPSVSWRAEVGRSIRLAEYAFSSPGSGGGWQAPNRVQGLRVRLEADQVRVEPRAGVDPAWRWGLRLSRYGREGKALSVERPHPSVRGHRIELARAGIVEWYVNAPAGVEHGFDIPAPPAGPSREDSTTAGMVILSLDVLGTLTPLSVDGSGTIAFRVPEGSTALHYSKLEVRDAGGRILPSAMKLEATPSGAVIRLGFDDSGASYPVVVDPVATTPGWKEMGGQQHSKYGWDARTAGDVNGDGFDDLIVGAWGQTTGPDPEDYQRGRVYLYYGSSSGPSRTPDWIGEGDLFKGGYGEAVASAGDINGDGYADILVGAPFGVVGGAKGRFLVYYGSPSGPEPSPALDIFSDGVEAILGWSLGCAGDVNGDGYADVIVSSSNYSGALDEEGLVWVFHGSPAGISSTPDWERYGGYSHGNFGIRVAGAGDVNGDGFDDVIIGSHLWENGQIDEGKVELFYGSPAGLEMTPAWMSESNQTGAVYGHSLGPAGDVNGDGYADFAIGALFWDNGEINEGGAFVFHGGPSGPGSVPAWTGEGNQHNAWYGFPVTTVGDVNGDGYSDLMAGAFLFDDVELDRGAAWLYLGSPSGLSATPAWQAIGPHGGAKLGNLVAPAGDLNDDGYSDFVVGAFQETDSEFSEGSASIYFGGPSMPSLRPDSDREGSQDGMRLGISVAAAGDVNGDGFGDLIAGADGFDGGEIDEGKVFLYLGSPAGIAATPAWEMEGGQEGARLGAWVSGAGDVNADGFADIVVAAPGYDGMMADQGVAWVFHGSPAGPAASPDWFAEGIRDGIELGTRAGAAGDVNGDGYGDLFVTSPGLPALERVAVYQGSPRGLDPQPRWIAQGEQAGSRFGEAAAGAGDVNGDGYADLIVGAGSWSGTAADQGKAYLYLGSATGLSRLPRWTVAGDQEGARFGRAVASAGDVNGDGLADVVVGSPGYDDQEPDEGRVSLYHGSIRGLEETPAWQAAGGQAGAGFGSTVSGAGDVNGDGRTEVLAGAADYDDFSGAGEDAGQVRLFRGSGQGLEIFPSWELAGSQSGAGAGAALGPAGDVNGDGFADLVVAQPRIDGTGIDDGRFDIFFGNAGPGDERLAGQLDAAGTRHLSMMEVVDPNVGFVISAVARSPLGPARVKLEWEVKPLGTPLDGSGTETSSSWTETGPGGVLLREQVAGLSPGTPYHWRARILYDASVSPTLRAGRWMSLTGQGWNQASLVTEGKPRHFNLLLDIRPRDPSNRIADASGGRVKVAILGTKEMPVGRLKARSLRFGPGKARPLHGLTRARLRNHRHDVNGDGIKDLVVHFRIAAAGLADSDTRACITGRTRAGVPVSACDTVEILP